MSPRQHTRGSRSRPDALPAKSDSALIIFAKAPVPGQVKTRLCPPLSPDEAASLHGSIVLDMLERSGHRAKCKTPSLQPPTSNHFDRFVACFPSPDHVFFKILEERHGVGLIAQAGEDLGARMAGALDDIFARGYRRALVIGTDLPTLPASVFGETFALLDTHDVVLGPARDGGYYLIGLRKPAPELFAGIPWSTDRVLALTQTKASAAGLKTALLPVRRDIDTLDDLVALIDETVEAPPHPLPPPQVGRVGEGKPRASNLRPQTSHLSPRTAGVLRLLADRLHRAPPPDRASRTPTALS